MKDDYYSNERYNQIDLSWFFPKNPHHRQSYSSNVDGFKDINDTIEHDNKKFRNKRKRP